LLDLGRDHGVSTLTMSGLRGVTKEPIERSRGKKNEAEEKKKKKKQCYSRLGLALPVSAPRRSV
jgi:hypothetical protein